MELKVIDNVKIKMVDVLNQSIESCTQLRMAVAFAKMSGYQLIKNSLDTLIHNNQRVILLFGLDFHTTDPEVLRDLLIHLDKKENFELFCLSGNLNKTATYHPKLYLFNHPKNEMTAIVGSSNLTRGGLENNVEINIAIRANYTEPIFTDLLDDFQQLEIADRRVRPNSTYIDYYEELYQLARKGKNIALHPKLKAFKTLESELPSPKLNANELVGWMKLVYDHLPTGQLPASEIYQYEKYFKNKYPENQFIQAKIRQQLQFLEKMGLLEKISRNNWKKV